MAPWRTVAVAVLACAACVAAPRAARGDDDLGAAASKEFRALAEAHDFRRMRERLLAFEDALGDPSAKVRAELEALKQDFVRARERWLVGTVAAAVPEELERAIRLQVADVKRSSWTVVRWAREVLVGRVYAAVAKRLQPLDDVTADEARSAWERRARGPWRHAEVPLGMSRDDVQVPDAWWRRATPAQRRERILLLVVAGSGLFEVRAEAVGMPCPTCHARGLVARRLPDGTVLDVLCRTCRGVRESTVLGYR